MSEVHAARPDADERERWTALLREGMPHVTLVDWIVNAAPFPVAPARRRTAREAIREFLLPRQSPLSTANSGV